jgi:hypothetical protein
MRIHSRTRRRAVIKKTKLRGLVRKRNIPTERPPLVGEVSANLLRVEGVAWPVVLYGCKMLSLTLREEPPFFLQYLRNAKYLISMSS